MQEGKAPPGEGEAVAAQNDRGSPRERHREVVSRCPPCAEEWESLGPLLQNAYRHLLAPMPELRRRDEPARDDLPVGSEAVDALDSAATPLRQERRAAKKQLSELRTTPRDERLSKVRRAHRRFRSRFLAELLIDEARSRVRNEPAEAESFAALVPAVLDWTQGAPDLRWAARLLLRAAAHRANALRVAGNLQAADELFAEVRAYATALPVRDPETLAEILSLEASLRIDQGRLEDADEGLRWVATAYRAVEDFAGLSRTLTSRANLLRRQQAPDAALRCLDELANRLPEADDRNLTLAATTCRVNALCDLGRAAEADRHLSWNLGAFDDGRPYTAAMLECLRGRIAATRGDHASAVTHFRSAADGMERLGRRYDTSLIELYAAASLLALGRRREAARRVAQLVEDFDRRQIPTDVAEARELLRRAVDDDGLTTALLVQTARVLLRHPVSHLLV